MKPDKKPYIIIGAGPTGLGAALRLREHGVNDFVILEADNVVGGLAKSFTDEAGFTWDIGGHVQFSHYTHFDEVMEAAIPSHLWHHHERESWVWVKDRFVPYPFQNNLKYLPRDAMWSCVEPLIDGKEINVTATPSNFREWILKQFGRGVADLFMLPYNFKVWATPPELMNYQWIGQRVSVPDVKRILGNIVQDKEDVSWGPNNTFHFPKKGGTGAIWERVADLVGRKHIENGAVVDGVDPKAKTVTLKDGRVFAYDKLLNTMPLDLFCRKVKGLDAAVSDRADELFHSTTHVFGLGMKGKIPPHLHKKCWMYFPESNCPFYRVTVFSHYSPQNVPDPETQWSLMLEVSESQHKPVDRKTIMETVVQGCLNTGLIASAKEIVSRFHFTAPYGYPVPSLERDAILGEVQPFLEQFGVQSRGRFGAWKYEVSNQDHSFMQGVEWTDRMLHGSEESTYLCRRGQAGKEPKAPLKKVA